MMGIDQYGYIAPAFSGFPWCGEKRDGKRVKMGDNSNVSHTRCISQKKPGMEQNLWKGAFPISLTGKGPYKKHGLRLRIKKMLPPRCSHSVYATKWPKYGSTGGQTFKVSFCHWMISFYTTGTYFFCWG